MISVEVHGTTELVHRLSELGQDAPKAATRAINKTLRSGTVAVRKFIRDDTGLTATAVGRSLDILKANYSTLSGTIAVSGYRDARGRMSKSGRIPLIEFRARGPEPSRGRGTGVRYTLPGSAGRIANAFIATMASGHRGVFKRMGKRRLPIQQLYGPSLERVMRRKGLDVTLPQIQTIFEKNLNHEINYILLQRAPAGDE